jgi:hypothetical protein
LRLHGRKLCRSIKCTSQELALDCCFSGDNRKPHIGPSTPPGSPGYSAPGVFSQFDFRPVHEVQNVTGCRESGKLSLKHCQAQIVNTVLLFNGKCRAKACCLRHDAMEVSASAITNRISCSSTYLGRNAFPHQSWTATGEVVQNLLGCLEHVRDGCHWSDFRRELNIAVRLGCILRNHSQHW